MQNEKSTGNDELTKEFYEKFRNKLIEIFVDSVLEVTKEKEDLSTSHNRKKLLRFKIHSKLKSYILGKRRSKSNIKRFFLRNKKRFHQI